MVHPTPWTYEKQEGGFGFHIKNANGKAIAQVWREAVAIQIIEGVNSANQNTRPND